MTLSLHKNSCQFAKNPKTFLAYNQYYLKTVCLLYALNQEDFKTNTSNAFSL